VKVIVATIRPEKLKDVQQALDGRDVRLMYTGQVADVWHERTCTYRGVKYRMPQPRLRLEILVVNEMEVTEIVEAINTAAFARASGLYDSGDLFIAHVEEWVSIRSRTEPFHPARQVEPEPSEVKSRSMHVAQAAGATSS
jgi:nitrogen regulatory protein P-II 1